MEAVLALTPEHISAYSLIVEEGTPFYERELNLPDEDSERRMYERTREILEEHGYHQYEISNYALRGKECLHNLGYWQRVSYLGVGLGAASLRKNVRYCNTSDLKEYLAHGADLDLLQKPEGSFDSERRDGRISVSGPSDDSGNSGRGIPEEFWPASGRGLWECN